MTALITRFHNSLQSVYHTIVAVGTLNAKVGQLCLEMHNVQHRYDSTEDFEAHIMWGE